MGLDKSELSWILIVACIAFLFGYYTSNMTKESLIKSGESFVIDDSKFQCKKVISK